MSALDGKEKSEPQQKGTQSGNIEVKLMSPVFPHLTKRKCKMNFKNIIAKCNGERLECRV